MIANGHANVGSVVIRGSNSLIRPSYEGEYIVIPKLHEQTLETRHKTMSNDVTVKEIPITVTSNPQGGKTVLIG